MKWYNVLFIEDWFYDKDFKEFGCFFGFYLIVK